MKKVSEDTWSICVDKFFILELHAGLTHVTSYRVFIEPLDNTLPCFQSLHLALFVQ